MKYILLATVAALIVCSGCSPKKTTLTGAATLTFDGLTMGTPFDTVLQRMPARPTLKTEDQLDYTDVMAEGVRWHQITYNFLGGQLARATATQVNADGSGYQKLYKSLAERYGKPAQNIDSLTIWVRRDAELSLQPGTILFSRR